MGRLRPLTSQQCLSTLSLVLAHILSLGNRILDTGCFTEKERSIFSDAEHLKLKHLKDLKVASFWPLVGVALAVSQHWLCYNTGCVTTPWEGRKESLCAEGDLESVVASL